ncbi:antitoxin [Subtercola sp. YIM 133946]|uniref:antitoxin n=1 Tax=Subtercola sp. YIM 133946 TaxID=3118909 RepID=UPI002F9462CD
MTAKLSVSLSDDDVEYIDALAQSRSGNRSAVIHDLVRIAREMRSVSDYIAANDEWLASAESRGWDETAGDGLGA